MWICSRCQTANKDGYTQCVQCSAPRNARRFGAGASVNAPSVQSAGAERRMQAGDEGAPAPVPPPRRQPPQEPPQKARRSPGALVRAVGVLLAILLPLMAALVAVQQADAFRPAVADFILGAEKPSSPVTAAPPAGEDFVVQPGEPLPPLADQAGGTARAALSWVLYALGTLGALLLAACPGLGLYALGHIARGVRRR